MYGKKEDVLPLVAPYARKGPPPPLPPLPEDEPGEEEADPLEQRHLPNSVEAAPIEEADIRRAMAQGETRIIIPGPVKMPDNPRQSVPRLRSGLSRRKYFALLALAAAVILFLILDGVLFLLNVARNHPITPLSSAHPTLTVTPTSAHPGQIVLLHISDFSPSTPVLLTRDMQQAVRTDSASSLIKVGTDGHADVHVLVQDSWESGTHLLVAEDIHKHFTASTSLRVTSDFPAPPPHLLIGTPEEPDGLSGPLSLGTGIQEVNTIQSLLLRNTGGSWISWQATSNQPWLALAPRQGVFQDNQGIFVAAARAHLAPGDYQGTITITSNVGKPVLVQVTMTALPSPKTASSLLVVEPPLLSFTTTDGASGPPAQYLTISNPGVRPLNWSLTASVPQDPIYKYLSSQSDSSWLETSATSGTVAPGASARITIMAQSQQLLPGVYGGVLLFATNGDPLNELQPVAIALTVQQHCGVIANQGSISLTVAAGQHASLDQSLALSTTAGCADVTNWQAFPQASWLRMMPASGQLQPNVTIKGDLLLDVSALTPGTYSSRIDLLTEMRSQTLMVQLTVLSPSATTPATTTGSSVPVTGTAASGTGTVVSATPTHGTATPTSTPVPGTPTPTPIPPSCTLHVAPAHLAFIASLLQPNPPAQTLVLSITGNCAQPVSWTASADANSQSWLHLGATSGIVSSNGSTLVVQVNASGKLLGTYTGQINLTAVDHSGVATKGSPQAISVTLTVVL